MRFVAFAVSVLVGTIANTGLAAEPFTSLGFLTFPPEAAVGAVSAVAVDRDDNVYVLQRGDKPIVVFDKNGKFVRAWGEGLFKTPHGLRIDRDGNVWTTDNGNHVLRKFSKSGELLATLGEPGKPGAGETAFRSPDDLVFDTQGNMYVADAGNKRIVKLDPQQKFIKQWGEKGSGPGQFSSAHGLAIDREDRIYVADRGNKRVQVFDNEGKYLADWTGFGNPFGLLVVGDELLVSEGDIHRVFHLDRDGKIVASWGNPESLQLPHFMAVNSAGVLYVCEINGKRVQMFRRR